MNVYTFSTRDKMNLERLEMVSFYNKPVIDTKRIERFHRVKKERMPFLTAILWELTCQRDLFKEAMQHALFGLWQQLDQISNRPDPEKRLYEIAIDANRHAWSQSAENQESEPAEGHHLSRLFGGRGRLPHRVRYTISQLNSFHGLLVVLRYVERKQPSSIAGLLKCEETDVEFGLSQALVDLKSRLRIHIKSALELHGLANSELDELEMIAV
jgi:DNA-directed RNA polymerase specialized sigma24 family protein